MKVKVAVATVQGKTYFYIVKELKQRNIPFFSLIPGQPIPVEVKVVITTNKEKTIIKHNKILEYGDETEPERLGNEVVRILRGKEAYENIVIGIDPGKVFGLAVVADGLVIHTENGFSVKEILEEIKNFLRVTDVSASEVTVKIGKGLPICKELLETLDTALPSTVILEEVSEDGTNRNICTGRRRGLRDIVSAIRIAARKGNIYTRGRPIEQKYRKR